MDIGDQGPDPVNHGSERGAVDAVQRSRVLAEDVAARRTQPPFPVSAMDGYAVRGDDLGTIPVKLSIVAEIPAGAGFGGRLGPGEAARIFTGAPLPDGSDTIVIQEDTERSGDRVEIREGAPRGRYVRPAGLDFAEGDVLLKAPRRLTPRDIGLAAAMNRLPSSPESRMSSSISMTAWLAPPWSGPQRAQTPAEALANRFALLEAVMRTVAVEQFCS